MKPFESFANPLSSERSFIIDYDNDKSSLLLRRHLRAEFVSWRKSHHHFQHNSISSWCKLESLSSLLHLNEPSSPSWSMHWEFLPFDCSEFELDKGGATNYRWWLFDHRIRQTQREVLCNWNDVWFFIFRYSCVSVMCASPQQHVFLERDNCVTNAKIYFSRSYVVIDL